MDYKVFNEDLLNAQRVQHDFFKDMMIFLAELRDYRLMLLINLYVVK